MPRKRRLGIARRSVRLDDLTCPDLLDLISGWHPPAPGEGGRHRWRTWADFMGDYGAVREEFLAAEWARPGEPLFAEWLYQRTGGDPARVADLERAGAPIVAAAVARFPALLLDAVGALFRDHVAEQAVA